MTSVIKGFLRAFSNILIAILSSLQQFLDTKGNVTILE